MQTQGWGRGGQARRGAGRGEGLPLIYQLEALGDPCLLFLEVGLDGVRLGPHAAGHEWASAARGECGGDLFALLPLDGGLFLFAEGVLGAVHRELLAVAAGHRHDSELQGRGWGGAHKSVRCFFISAWSCFTYRTHAA
jgi:hypothetical protein